MEARMRAQLKGDPLIYTGDRIEDLLLLMREGSPYPEGSLREWMQAYATRVQRWDGGPLIDCSTPESFWRGLIQRDLLTVTEP